MDSGNSGSISSSGDEEYDSSSRARDHQNLLLPSSFLDHHSHGQFGNSISSNPQTSLVQTHHHPSLFDLSPAYLHALSQSQQPNSNSLLNLDPNIASRSTPNCTVQAVSVSVSPPSSTVPPAGVNQCLLAPQQTNNNNNNASAPPRNSKKRTRASRRAPTTVLTTDTSNFRAMVQEFTGIPAPPFSGSSYSRRLDLLTGSSSLRSGASHHLDSSTGNPFYPLRPSPQKPHHHHNQNPLLPSTLLHNNNMVDALGNSTTTNVTSSATANNNNNNSSPNNYHLLPPDLGLPYHHHHQQQQQQQNIMLSMQSHHQPVLAFHAPQPPLHHLPAAGFGANKSQQMPMSLEDLGMSHGEVNNAHHLVGSGVRVTDSEGMSLRNVGHDDDDGGAEGGGGSSRRDPLRSFGGSGSCKLDFSASASGGLNNEKNLESGSARGGGGGEGAVDSWICSSD